VSLLALTSHDRFEAPVQGKLHANACTETSNPCNWALEPDGGARLVRLARILLKVRMRVYMVIAAALSVAPQLASAEPYVSAQLGAASAAWPVGPPLNGRIDDSVAGYGIDFGVSFAKRWAVELGAYGYDSFDAQGSPCAPGTDCPPVVTGVSGTDITIYKVALAPRFVVGNVRLFGTFGYYQARIDTNLALPDSTQRDRGALLGLGARWYFREPWSVSVQATRFDDNLRQLMFGVGWGLTRDRSNADD
jgi:hypothetical protein